MRAPKRRLQARVPQHLPPVMGQQLHVVRGMTVPMKLVRLAAMAEQRSDHTLSATRCAESPIGLRPVASPVELVMQGRSGLEVGL